MVLRPLGLDDIDDVMKVEHACFPTSHWSIRDFVHEVTSNPFAHYYCLDEEDGITGVLGMWFTYENATVTTIGILPDHRDRGKARALLTYGLKEAHEHGCLSCDLEVRVSNEAAIHLYESLGFENKAIRKNYYADNHEDAYLMVKEGGLYGNDISD